MRKVDLKDGMICELRDNTRGIWLNGRVRTVKRWYSDIRDDLTNGITPNFDIVRVYEASDIGCIEYMLYDVGKLIWERPAIPIDDGKEEEPIVVMTVNKLMLKLRKDGKEPTYIYENYSALRDLLRSQKEFDIQTQGINKLMEIVFKRTCYARSLAGYFAGLYESGYITESEYQQVAIDAGVVRYV